MIYDFPSPDISLKHKAMIENYINVNSTSSKGCRQAQLTKMGYETQVSVGSMLRRSYVATKFVSPIYNSTEIYLRADEKSRVIGSLQGLMNGLFPGSQTNAFVYDVMDLDADPIYSFFFCPKYNKYSAEFQRAAISRKLELDKLESQVADTMRTLINYNDLLHLWECMIFYNCHHYETPLNKSFQVDFINRFGSIRAERMLLYYNYPSLEERSRVAFGIILKEWYDRWKLVVNGGNNPFHKLAVYSGHDFGILALLAALGFKKNISWPAYSSVVQLELYQNAHQIDSQFYLRLIYNGKEETLPFCENFSIINYNSGKLCPWARVVHYLDIITPENITTECGSDPPQLQFVVYVVGIVVIFMMGWIFGWTYALLGKLYFSEKK